MLGNCNIHTKPCPRYAFLCKSFLDVLPWYKMFILDLQIDKYHSTAATRTCHGGTEFRNKGHCKTKKIRRDPSSEIYKKDPTQFLTQISPLPLGCCLLCSCESLRGRRRRGAVGTRTRATSSAPNVPHRHDDSEDPPHGELLFCSLGEFFFRPWRRTLLGF
jgi:hypothetical protein